MEYQTYCLKNGIRLIHKEIQTPVAHCGIIINTGSRDEKENEHGIAHLVEHMIFKGTRKRKVYHILSRMEDVGGEINAYTTKEETCIHTSFFNNYYPRAFDLISDIVFNSGFPLKEIEKEKEIIIDEINAYKDSPVELIFDEFEELVFQNNPLGRNILGDKKSLKKIDRNNILSFLDENYSTNQMVVASVGKISFHKLIKYFEKYFSEIPSKSRSRKREIFNNSNVKSYYKTISRNTHQSHCIIGNIGYNVKDEKRLSLYLLNNLIGGPGLNSRLNLILREKKGYAYNVESNYSTYRDTGIISIYFGTDKIYLDKCIHLINKELCLLKTKKLGTSQLTKAKKQLLGQIAISSENNENRMLSIGKSLLVFDHVESLKEISKKIENIESEKILEIANEIFDEKKLSTLMYK